MRLELRKDAPVWQLWAGWLRVLAGLPFERPFWLALAAGLAALALVYQSPRSLFLDIGGAFDGAQTPGFHSPEQSGQASFRWSSGQSSLVFPGIGRAFSPFPVRLQLASGRGANSAPVEVGVSVNGRPAPPLSLSPEGKLYSVEVQPSWVMPDQGDLVLDFQVPTFRASGDSRDLGFIADFARVDLPGGPVVPPLPQIALLLLSAALIYFLARGCWLRPWPSGGLSLAFLLVCAGLIALQRLLLTTFTGRLVVTLLLALLLVLLAEPAVRVLVRAAGWRGEAALPEWAWTGLRALVLVSAALKVGGLLYPSTFIIDAYFHLKYTTYAAEGRPFEQFFGRNLSLSVMPKDEWGAARAVIPYSPFFYFAASPLLKLPWPKELTVPVFAALFEALKVTFVFLLGLSLGPARGAARRALAAAAVYSAIPATFLLQQFGNWPTQLALWLITLWAALVCLFWNRMTPLVWIASTVVLTLAVLSYTVMAVYSTLFLGLLVVGGWLLSPGQGRRWGGLALSLLAGLAAGFVLFYGRYASTLINETLPTFGKAVNEQGKLTTLHPTVGAFLTGTLGEAMQSYNLVIPYALGFAGALLVLFGARALSPAPGRAAAAVGIAVRPLAARRWQVPWYMVWLGAWMLCFFLFTALDFYVDQVFKEFWFPLPVVAIVGGLWLLAMRALERGTRVSSLLVWLLCATLVWQSLTLWVFRLLFHNR